jgi:hypothetical protein
MNPGTNNPAACSLTGLPQTTPEMDRNGSQLDNPAQVADRDELRYDSVPPKKSVTVSVRYRIRGRGRPLPYSLDEEEGQ